MNFFKKKLLQPTLTTIEGIGEKVFLAKNKVLTNKVLIDLIFSPTSHNLITISNSNNFLINIGEKKLFLPENNVFRLCYRLHF